MYINSPGGVVTSGLAIYDTMQYIRPPVSTLCIGQAASMGSLLLAAGAKDMRFALPNARIMVHQPSGGFQGQATDIMLHAQEILNLKRRLNEIYVKHTGQPLKTIEDALERDMFLTAEMAKDFGLIDKVIEKRPEEPGLKSEPRPQGSEPAGCGPPPQKWPIRRPKAVQAGVKRFLGCVIQKTHWCKVALSLIDSGWHAVSMSACVIGPGIGTLPSGRARRAVALRNFSAVLRQMSC